MVDTRTDGQESDGKLQRPDGGDRLGVGAEPQPEVDADPHECEPQEQEQAERGDRADRAAMRVPAGGESAAGQDGQRGGGVQHVRCRSPGDQ
jgi:hypothetical protein